MDRHTQSSGKRRGYTGEFKARVVFETLNRRKTLSAVAEENGLHPNQIKNWATILRKSAGRLLEDKRAPVGVKM
jgi:transposase-like protein